MWKVLMPRSRLQRTRWFGTLAFLLLGGCRPSTAPSEHVVVLEVAPTTVACTGSFPTTCLQVRERQDAPWQYFYDPIEGFSFEPGYHYWLRVAVRVVPNPPADGSSRAYRLIAILSKRSE